MCRWFFPPCSLIAFEGALNTAEAVSVGIEAGNLAAMGVGCSNCLALFGLRPRSHQVLSYGFDGPSQAILNWWLGVGLTFGYPLVLVEGKWEFTAEAAN